MNVFWRPGDTPLFTLHLKGQRLRNINPLGQEAGSGLVLSICYRYRVPSSSLNASRFHDSWEIQQWAWIFLVFLFERPCHAVSILVLIKLEY
jgi:hypothetical protein